MPPTPTLRSMLIFGESGVGKEVCMIDGMIEA